MEIWNYVRRRPIAAAVVLLAPLFAAATAFVLLRDRPPTFRASVVVEAPPEAGRSISQAQITTTRLLRLMGSEEIVPEVVAATDMEPEEFVASIEGRVLPQSTLIEFALEGDDEDDVSRGLALAVRRAFERDSNAELDNATRTFGQVEERYRAARDAVDQFRRNLGSPRPIEEFEQLLRDVRSRQDDIVLQEALPATIERNVRLEVSLQLIEQQRARLAALEAAIPEYELVEGDLEAAQESRDSARLALIRAQNSLDRELTDLELGALEVAEITNRTILLQGIIGASGLAVLAALILAGIGRLARPHAEDTRDRTGPRAPGPSPEERVSQPREPIRV